MSKPSSFALRAAFAYSLAIAYGTLFPLTDWSIPPSFQWLDSLPTWQTHTSKTDLLTNLLAYVPVGFLLAWGLRPRIGGPRATLVALLSGTSVSLSLEVIQGVLPARVSSLDDLVANSVSTLAGALVATLISPSEPLGRSLRETRRRWTNQKVEADTGLAVLALWALSQLSPLVPSADIGQLREGLRPLWTTLNHPSRFDLHHTVTYLLAVCGVGLLTSVLLRTKRKVSLALPVFVYGVLLLKVPVMTRQLSLEAILGSTVGLVVFFALRGRPGAPIALLSAGAILGSHVLEGLRVPSSAPSSSPVQDFSWIPFAEYRLNLYDFADILGTAWAPFALAYLVRHHLAHRPPPWVATAGAIFVFSVVFSIEWAQRYLPGRSPDLTDCLVAVGAWLIPWVSRRHKTEAGTPSRS